jgi:hypothetical protein
MGSVSAAIGLMHERVRPKAQQFFQTDDTLYSKFEEKTDEDSQSYRPMKVPAIILEAAKFQQTDINGGSLGLGAAPQTDAGTLVPIVFSQSSQYTKLTELTTKSTSQAIENFVVKTQKLAMESFRERLEAAIQGDSSGTLDTVVAVAGNVVTVNNANMFASQVQIDAWNQVGGGVFRGTGTVYSTDANNKQIILTAPIPGLQIGDVLLIRGSSGQAGTSVSGVKTYHVNSNVGSWMGVPRTSYQGRLSTPNVNAQNQPLTPGIARRSIAAIQRALGIRSPEQKKLMYYGGLDTVAAWENVGITIIQNIYQQIKGDESPDMLKKNPPATFAGREMMVGLHATPGRIDGFCLAHWFRTEFQKIDHYEVGGQTIFPQIAPDGGLMTNMLFYLYIGFNIGMDNPLAGVFINNIPVTSGY